MAADLFTLALGLLVTVTVVAVGSYVGALRALDVFHSGEDSVFLSDGAGPRDDG